MRRAIELSRLAVTQGDGGPFGCVIVRDGVIVGEGWNRVISRTDPTAHGEMEAIRDASGRLGTFVLKGCDLYTSAQPCPMCLAAIYWARIDRVFYGNTVEDAAAIGFDDVAIREEVVRPSGDRKIPEIPLLRDEANVVFRTFAADPERVKY
jgi:tRNA(Arg) A34 adenosine deaminase TadA